MTDYFWVILIFESDRFEYDRLESTHLTRPYSKTTLLVSKVKILSKVENTPPYSKYDRIIIGHFKK